MPVHEDVVSHQHECGLWVVVIHLFVVIIAAACSHLMLPVHAVCAHASMGLAQAVAPRWMGWRLAAHMALATDSRSSSSTPSSCERRKVQKLVLRSYTGKGRCFFYDYVVERELWSKGS